MLRYAPGERNELELIRGVANAMRAGDTEQGVEPAPQRGGISGRNDLRGLAMEDVEERICFRGLHERAELRVIKVDATSVMGRSGGVGWGDVDRL